MDINLNFDPQPKYIEQARQILEVYLQGLYPECISHNDISVELIRNIEKYQNLNMNIEILSSELMNDGAVDWDFMNELNELENDAIPEVYRRIQWLYDGKSAIKFDVYFIARVLKTISDVGVETFLRDFL